MFLEGVIHCNWLSQHTVVQVFCCICEPVIWQTSEHVLICSWTSMDDGSLLQILAGIVVLSQCWYNSSAGDGSSVLMGVAWSASRVKLWIGTTVLGSVAVHV